MTPITKNITVTDDAGKLYEPTYFKRANGLVKHGRARWLSDNTICLACPPDMKETEDIPMDERISNNIKDQIEFLKSDLNCEFPNSELGAKSMVQAREATKAKILHLMDRLAGVDPEQDDRRQYRELLERIVNDRTAIDAAKEAVSEMDDDDCKVELIRDVCALYESSKKEIAAKIIEKLG